MYRKMGISFGLAMLTSIATWILTIPDLYDFGIYATLIATAITLVANLVREFVKAYKLK